jgi:hypothetical protein
LEFLFVAFQHSTAVDRWADKTVSVYPDRLAFEQIVGQPANITGQAVEVRLV